MLYKCYIIILFFLLVSCDKSEQPYYEPEIDPVLDQIYYDFILDTKNFNFYNTDLLKIEEIVWAEVDQNIYAKTITYVLDGETIKYKIVFNKDLKKILSYSDLRLIMYHELGHVYGVPHDNTNLNIMIYKISLSDIKLINNEFKLHRFHFYSKLRKANDLKSSVYKNKFVYLKQ